MNTLEDNDNFNPFLIGICGGSASGKTTAASFITQFVGEENCLLFSLDNYFFGPNDEERKHIQDYNFDRPEALDLDLAYQHLLELKEGKTIDMPVYNFNISKRMNYTQKVKPKKVIIFEGIFSLYEKRMRDLMDIKLFFDLDSDIRFFRRIIRDISDRSRKIDTVIERYFRFVKPAFDRYILPTKKYADFVIPQDSLSSLPIEMVSQNIIVNVLHSRKITFDKNRRKESMSLIKEDSSNKTFFYYPNNEKDLSVVTSNEDIQKFTKIIHHIIQKMNYAYYPIYCNFIIEYLLNEHKKRNKDNLRNFLIEIPSDENVKEIKQKITKEDKCIISLFEPILIKKNDDFEKNLKSIFAEFKDYNTQFELLSVYMSDKIFQDIKEVVKNAKTKMHYITIYFGNSLDEYDQKIIEGGGVTPNVIDSGEQYLNRANLISKFHFEKNKYIN